MSEALFILIGLVVVGAVIWAGSRQPPDPNASTEDNPYSITDPSRTLFSSDPNQACDPNDRDGDGIPDSIDAHDNRDDGFFGSSDDNDSGGDDDSGGSDSSSSD